MEETEEPLKPAEVKTYTPSKLRQFVYWFNKKGRPISYQRIYNRSWEQVKKINRAVELYYQKTEYEPYEDPTEKMNLQTLVEETGICQGVVLSLLIKMANVKQVLVRIDNRWKIERSKPYIIIQQKAKHVQREYWGKKTPLYIYPFDERMGENIVDYDEKENIRI